MIIIKRREADFINNLRKWVFLFGRRKTGKTFLVKNFVKFDEYYFIKRDRTIINDKEISYETFTELLKLNLKNNKTIVVDEFHRLEDGFLDFLHSIGNLGKLILLSSTLHLSKKLLSGKSPLLGLVAEIPLGLVPLNLPLKEINKLGYEKKEVMELATFCIEPMIIDYIKEKTSARELISNIMISTKYTVPALIGEIFTEEDRQISNVYEGILRAVSVGKNKAGEIANHLFSKKLIKKESSTMIQQYLKNLIEFGILKRILIFNKKEYKYDLTSPLMKFYFYADEKYNFGEEATPEKAEFILQELIPKIIESKVREFFAYRYGLREAIIETKDYDIDGCLLKFKKPEILLEIKWKKLDKGDIKKVEENLSKIKAKRKILFTQDKKDVKTSLEVLDVDDLTKL